MMCVDIRKMSGDLESLKDCDRENFVAAHSTSFVEPHSSHLIAFTSRLYFAVVMRKPNTLMDVLKIASIWLSRESGFDIGSIAYSM